MSNDKKMSYKEIGDRVGLSPQGTINSEIKALNKMYKKLLETNTFSDAIIILAAILDETDIKELYEKLDKKYQEKIKGEHT